MTDLGLLTEEEIFAFLSQEKNDTPENRRELLRTPKYCYRYCSTIKDDPEIARRITDSKLAYLYCMIVRDDPEIAKHIKDKTYIRAYKQYKLVNDSTHLFMIKQNKR